MQALYIFLDEGGNLDFSKNGTKYFSLTALTMLRDWNNINNALDNKKYSIIESDYNANPEYFHCSDDNKYIRDEVFEIIANSLDKSSSRIDSMIIEKIKTSVDLQDEKHFYPKMLSYLLKHIFCTVDASCVEEIIVITDQLPLKRKKNAIEKAIKQNLSEMLGFSKIKHRIFHHSSRAHYGLQIVDYCNWAISRKWITGEEAYYNKIKFFIRSELDIFKEEKMFSVEDVKN